MSADKRKVSTDALETLGSIIDEHQKRDAIHIAVEPTIAKEKLYPGQNVGVDGTSKNPVGIVDPFLKNPVMPEERFWLLVYPREITSLRHVWTHPAFEGEPQAVADVTSKQVSEQWLRDYCRDSDAPSYEKLIYAAVENTDSDYLLIEGQDAHGTIPPELWNHIEIVTGKKISNRPEYFTCSC
jgi:hypothetical protein